MSLKELIQKISEQPSMYLGEPTLQRFESFLIGWTFGQDVRESETLLSFQKWIQKHYGIRLTQSWANIIKFYSATDPDALETAFRLFKEYFREIENGENPR